MLVPYITIAMCVVYTGFKRMSARQTESCTVLQVEYFIMQPVYYYLSMVCVCVYEVHSQSPMWIFFLYKLQVGFKEWVYSSLLASLICLSMYCFYTVNTENITDFVFLMQL